MTRSSTNELFTPFKDPEREFLSSRKHFTTLSLDELRSHDFNLFSDQEYSEKEFGSNGGNYGQTMSKTRLTKDLAWERFKELLLKWPQHYFNGDQETVADAKVAIQEMAEYSQKWHNGTSRSRSTETSDGLTAIQAQLNNLGKIDQESNDKVYAAPSWMRTMQK
ncbi:hypothetical protein Tco_0168124 [Tanacetum coccineum]